MTKIYKYKIIFIVIALCQFGCASSSYTLVYHQKDFKPHNLDVITVLPVVDARQQVFEKTNFEEETEEIQELIIKKLKKKGYACKAIYDANAMGNILPTQIPFLDASRISKIGPGDANWILLPVVIALKPFMGATTKQSEIVFYLFEKPTGELVWEGSGRLFKNDMLGATKKLLHDFPSKK